MKDRFKLVVIRCCLFAALVAVAVCDPVFSEDTTSPGAQKVALLVGISDYFDKNMDDLDFAENDVQSVGAELRNLGFRVTVIRGRDATRQRVDSEIEQLIAKSSAMESESIVFLMFSGHGQQLEALETDARSGAQELKDVPYFCPRDAKPFDATRHDIKGKTAAEIEEQFSLISLNRITNELERRSNSSRNLVIVDACRNNPASGKAAGITKTTARNLPAGISILFAARGGQKSWESVDGEIKHGVMSHFLIKGLKGAARNNRDQVTWSRVVNYVREEVEYQGWKIAGGEDRRQNPHAIMNSDQTIVLGTPKPDFEWLTQHLYREGTEGFLSRIRDEDPGDLAGLAHALELTRSIDNLFQQPEELWFQLQARNLTYRDRVVAGIVSSHTPAKSPRGTTASLEQIGGPLRHQLYHHSGAVIAIACSPDGRFIASGGADDDIEIWDAKTFRHLQELVDGDSLFAHSDDVHVLQFTADSKTLVSGSQDKTVKVWELADSGSSPKFNLSANRGYKDFADGVHGIAVSNDGELGAAICRGSKLVTWSLNTGELVQYFTLDDGRVFESVAISPDSRRLVAGSSRGKIWLWNVGDWDNATGIDAHIGEVRALAFESNGQHLWSAGDDYLIKRWRLSDRTCVMTRSGHTAEVYSIALSGDDKLLASHGNDNTLRYWDLATGEQSASFPVPMWWRTQLAFTVSGEHLVTGSDWGNRSLKFWDSYYDKHLNANTDLHDDTVRSIEHTNGSSRLMVTASDDNTIKVWNAASGQLVRTLAGHTADVMSLSISPDNRFVASASNDKTVCIWSLPSGELVKTLTGHTDEVKCVAYSANGRALVTGSSDRTIKVWRTADYGLERTISDHADAVLSVAFSPDGRTMASGGDDGALYIWSLPSFEIKQKHFRGEKTFAAYDDPFHAKGINDLRFSPDGKWLASAGDDNDVILWNAIDHEYKRRLSHGSIAYRVAFSDDSQSLCSADFFKRQVHRWDVKSGTKTNTLQLDSLATAVDFNGAQVVAGDGGGRIHRFELPETK